MHIDPAWWDEIKDSDGADCCPYHRTEWHRMLAMIRRERMRAEYPAESEALDLAEATVALQSSRITHMEAHIEALLRDQLAAQQRRVVFGAVDVPERSGPPTPEAAA